MEGLFYVNEHLRKLMYEELRHHSDSKGKLVCTGIPKVKVTVNSL